MISSAPAERACWMISSRRYPGFIRILFRIAGPVALGAWLLSGFYFVEPDEEAVRTRFKRIIDEKVGPGLHYHAPWPLEEALVQKTAAIFKVGIGFDIFKSEQLRLPSPDQTQHLTGDTNIIDVQLIIQYTVRSAADLLFHSEKPKAILKRCGEDILIELVSSMDVDELLTAGKAELSEQMEKRLQQRIDRLGTGIEISSASLVTADPSLAVRLAFQEVVDARADRERLIHEANIYRNRILPMGKGRAAEIQEAACGTAQDILSAARSDRERFETLLEVYEISPAATRLDLFLGTAEKILGEADLIVSPAGGIPVRLFPKEELSGETPIEDEPSNRVFKASP